MLDGPPKPTILSQLAKPVVAFQHAVRDWVHPFQASVSDLPAFVEVHEHCRVRTDISDHLTTLFSQTIAMQPRLIAELGVRGGESTFVLERVAKLCAAPLVSVDIEDCSSVCNYPNWHFNKSDDIQFAKDWPKWVSTKGLPATIDVLFIDTSHIYEHTVQEIKHWFPLLSPKCKVMFHDTNQRKIYWRKDGSVGIGWNNNRGVMAAIEEYFDTKFDESRDFVELHKGWVISHTALCSGFTTLTRY